MPVPVFCWRAGTASGLMRSPDPSVRSGRPCLPCHRRWSGRHRRRQLRSQPPSPWVCEEAAPADQGDAVHHRRAGDAGDPAAVLGRVDGPDQHAGLATGEPRRRDVQDDEAPVGVAVGGVVGDGVRDVLSGADAAVGGVAAGPPRTSGGPDALAGSPPPLVPYQPVYRPWPPPAQMYVVPSASGRTVPPENTTLVTSPPRPAPSCL
jgi:hypothetical protein